MIADKHTEIHSAVDGHLYLVVNFTPEQWDMVSAAAEIEGETVEEFVMSAVMGRVSDILEGSF